MKKDADREDKVATKVFYGVATTILSDMIVNKDKDVVRVMI